MKIIHVLLGIAAVFILIGASIWEGAAAIAPRGVLPASGYYAATNSFSRNTMVNVVNLENGKTVQVTVSAGLDNTGLLILLSKDAADAIGIQGSARGRVRIMEPADPLEFSPFTEGRPTNDDPDFGRAFHQEGQASWYGTEFDGQMTASGEPFDSAKFTAAHPSLPFGTLLTITNTYNNKRVVVRVNDRGPFIFTRIIDLSKAAAEQLDMTVAGTARVVDTAAEGAVVGPVGTPGPAVAGGGGGTVPAKVADSDKSASPQKPIGQSTLEAALYSAANGIIVRLKPPTTVAVISITSEDVDYSAESVLDELVHVIKDSDSFKVVDRKSLDVIRTEQIFQAGAEVADGSAVSIGNMLGANIVIIGSISRDGPTWRLRLRALDVKTAEVVATASESY